MTEFDPADTAELLKARDLRALAPVLRRLVAQGLGPGASVESLTIILPSIDPPGYAFLCNEHTAATHRRFLVVGTRASFDELPAGATVASSFAPDMEDLLDLASCAGVLARHGAARSILIRAKTDSGARAAILFSVAEGSPLPAAEALSGVERAVEILADLAPAILEGEMLRRELSEMMLVHEAMLRALAAPDKAAVLDALTELIEQHFGFRRILIMLIDGASGLLRGELHKGFDGGLSRFSIDLQESDNFFVRSIKSGRILIFGPAAERVEGLEELTGSSDIERAVLIPLSIGTRPLGFVYADRPRTDDILLFPKICEVFARLASMAIENIARRLDAEKRAETDPLTGIHNRYFLNRVLEVEIPRVKRYSSPISLLMIDLRDFKRTNDTYGHIFGDHILRETAVLIQANIREPDIVVRFGGDEFVVLMVNTSYDQAKLVQERIERAFIERNQAQSDERMMIDISTGLRSADAKTITTLLEDADHQMYLHKAEQTRSEIVEALLGLPSARSDVIDSVISTLLSNLDNKDPSNREHRWRVAYLCLVILKELRLPPADIQTIILAALLHDVGQASLPAEILQRRGSLTESEKRAVQSHSVIGEEFLRGLAHLEPARPIIRHHHERYDGLTTGEFPGYPAGLSGDAIPLGARIVKLADSVDALHSSRPYREGLALDEVIRTIKKESGASFDPKLVEILLGSTDWSEKIDSRQALYDLYREVMKQSIAMEKLRSPYEEVTQPV